MKERGVSSIIFVMAIVIIIAAVIAGGYFLLKGEGEEGGGNDGVASASSLDIKVDAAYQGQTQTTRYRVKNINTGNDKYRIDGYSAGEIVYIFLVNAVDQTVYFKSNGEWENYSDNFQLWFQSYQQFFQGYQMNLSGWAGGIILSRLAMCR